MTDKRSVRGSYVSKATGANKGKQNNQGNTFIIEKNLTIVYYSEFYEQYLLLCTKKSLKIYNLAKQTKEQIKITTNCATFIPFTHYIAFPQSQQNDNSRDILTFWNYHSNSLMAKLKVNFKIQGIKASRHCILIKSQQSIYIIHFPSLRPIYEGLAGNGIEIICDISREGLTFAHNSQKKGELVIRNFTNIQTNRLLADIKSNSKRQTMNQKFKAYSSKSLIDQPEEQEIKDQIKIKAHQQNVLNIKLSPNGYRVVTASAKGTVIRLFSCLNGKIISEYYMSSELSPVIDISFIAQGNAIVCLNERNNIHLFHTKMLEEQLISQSARRGCQIYQMQNPTPFFSFLGFLNPNLRYQRPFSYWQLSTQTILLEEKKKTDSIASEKIIKNQKLNISQIKQQQHLDQHLQQHNFIQQNESQKIQMSPHTDNKNIKTEQIQIEQLINSSQNHLVRKDTMNDLKHKRQTESKRRSSSNLIRKISRNNSIKSAGLMMKKPSQTITIKQQEKEINIRGTIYFQDSTNIKIIRSKYYYHLKYDPFNGGEMVQKKSYNILTSNLFNDL